jgi:hypothetical protein
VDPLIKRELLYQLSYKGDAPSAAVLPPPSPRKYWRQRSRFETLARLTEEARRQGQVSLSFQRAGIGG